MRDSLVRGLGKLKRGDGITLIESLVYLALFGMIFTVIVMFTLSIGENNREAKAKNELERVALFVSEHFDSTLAEANGVDDVGSVFESDNGVLRLNTDSGYQEYRLSGGKVDFNNNGSVTSLTTSGYIVNRLYVEKVVNKLGETVGVRVIVGLYSVKDPEISRSLEMASVLKYF